MICQRCMGTGFDPDIELPGSCDHSGQAPTPVPHQLRTMYRVFNRPLPVLRKATVTWFWYYPHRQHLRVPKGRVKPLSLRSIDDRPGSLYDLG